MIGNEVMMAHTMLEIRGLAAAQAEERTIRRALALLAFRERRSRQQFFDLILQMGGKGILYRCKIMHGLILNIDRCNEAW